MAKSLDSVHYADALIARHPQRVLTIRYEDFLSDQAHTLQRVCAFFGIEFLPRMPDIANSSEARRISRMSALWASNCSTYPTDECRGNAARARPSTIDLRSSAHAARVAPVRT